MPACPCRGPDRCRTGDIRMTEAFAATLVPTILAGGSGTRLWPVSRAAFPKHLVELFGEELLLQTTARRALDVAPAGAGDHGRRGRPGGADPTRSIRRSTRGCRTICCWSRRRATPRPRSALGLAACRGAYLAATRCLVGLPVRPSDARSRGALRGASPGRARPRPRAGWSPSASPRRGRRPASAGSPRRSRCRATPRCPARRALHREAQPRRGREPAGGRHHLWNSGMFVFQARPDAGRAGALGAGYPGRDACRLPGARRACRPPASSGRLRQIRSQPIDKAVMEQSEHVAVVPADPQWSDVGSWHAIWELMDKDEHGQCRPGRYDRDRGAATI